MAPAVAGQEGHPPAADRADRDGRRRRPVGRVEGHLDGVVEERVEPRAAEDADLGLGRGPAHAILLSVFDELLDDESDDDEDEDEELDVVSFSFVLDPPPPRRLSVL